MYNKKAVKFYDEGRQFHQNGNLSDAERAYKKAVKINQNFVEAHNNLGNVLLDRGRLKAADAAYRKALKLLPGHPMILSNIGNTLQLQGENEKALRWLDKAISQDPHYADAYSNLGNALRDMGRFEKAVAAYKQAIKNNPGLAEAFINLGGVLVDMGELSDAVINFNKAIDIDPAHKDAYNGLGNAFSELDDFDKAIAAYNKAIEIDPMHKNAYNGLGNALCELGEIDKAIEAYNKAIKIEPMHRNAYIGLGVALSDHGEIEQATASFRKAIEFNPERAYIALGNELSDIGEIEQAIAAYRQSIKISSECADIYHFLSKNKKYSEYDDDIRAMECLYSSENIVDEQKMHISFGLGKAYEDLGEYEKSMEFILQATRLKRATLDYSISEEEDLFRKIIATFTSEFFANHKYMGNPDTTPIFILGMPRSGTSLTEQILASHPDVFGAGELKDLAFMITKICAAGQSRKYPACVVDLEAATFGAFGKEYIARIRKHSEETSYITNKMPHNFLYIGLIYTILPNAKIIHCTRNPMDNCLSLFKNYFSSPINYSYDLTELGQYYNLYVDLMAHWKNTLPGFIYDLGYEDLVADQEYQIRKLLDYCQLPWDDACLDFHRTRRRVRTASNAQVRRPIYKDSVKLWKRYEKQLEPLRTVIGG